MIRSHLNFLIYEKNFVFFFICVSYLHTWITWWMISVGPVGPLWRCYDYASASVPQSRESLGECNHCICVPSGIFISCHRHWVFNCMRDTVPTFYISLKVKIPFMSSLSMQEGKITRRKIKRRCRHLSWTRTRWPNPKSLTWGWSRIWHRVAQCPW